LRVRRKKEEEEVEFVELKVVVK